MESISSFFFFLLILSIAANEISEVNLEDLLSIVELIDYFFEPVLVNVTIYLQDDDIYINLTAVVTKDYTIHKIVELLLASQSEFCNLIIDMLHAGLMFLLTLSSYLLKNVFLLRPCENWTRIPRMGLKEYQFY